MNIIERNYAMKIDNLVAKIDKASDNESFYNNRNYLTGDLIDTVHAIADCYERNRDKLSGEDKEFILAFRYLNNQIKHDKTLEVFSMQVYSALLPSRLPLMLGSSYCSILWCDFEDHGRKKTDARREYYDKYLKSKDMKDTLVRAKKILDNIVM